MSGAGDQVPVTPLEEVVGKGFNTSPSQIGGIGGLKTAIVGFTIICTILDKAHCPIFEVGVKVYVPLFILLTIVGFHVPTIPLLERFDKTGGVEPEQIDAGNVKVGVTLFTTKIVNGNELAH